MPIRKKLIIFDLDGVLVDSVSNMRTALKKTSVLLDIKLDFESYRNYLGLPFEKIMKKMGIKKNINTIKLNYSFFSKKTLSKIKIKKEHLQELKYLHKKYNFAIKKFLKNHKSKIIFEPGRSIVGNIGSLVSKVIYIKENDKKNFIILDAAMNDFMRPALYGAIHRTLPIIKINQTSKKVYEFVGPICESTDKFTTLKKFQKLKENDLVVMCDVGAYGMSLSSNYNVRPKPAEILIKGSKINLIKKRQKLEDLI